MAAKTKIGQCQTDNEHGKKVPSGVFEQRHTKLPTMPAGTRNHMEMWYATAIPSVKVVLFVPLSLLLS